MRRLIHATVPIARTTRTQSEPSYLTARFMSRLDPRINTLDGFACKLAFRSFDGPTTQTRLKRRCLIRLEHCAANTIAGDDIRNRVCRDINRTLGRADEHAV
jgi:hypothetical protein